jgi:hypothetical protein
LGIFHVLVGTFGVINGLFTLTVLFAPASLLGEADGPRQAIQARFVVIPGQQAVTILEAGLEIGLSVLLIVAGCAFLQMRRAARPLSLIYAVLSILNHAFALTWLHFHYGDIVDAIDTVLGADLRLAMFSRMFRGVYVGVPLIWALGIAYPIVVLWLVLSRSVRIAFSGGGPRLVVPDEGQLARAATSTSVVPASALTGTQPNEPDTTSP